MQKNQQQKTAYEIRIRDWSSDVCSSDLDESFKIAAYITYYLKLIDLENDKRSGLLKTLTQFAEYFGAERQATVSREISKLHEETVRGLSLIHI